MKLTSLSVFLLLFCAVRALPQEIGQIFGSRVTFAETATSVMTKVIVCAEDQSVWALSAAGEVYYKLSSDASFTKYVSTNGMQVADLAGYNANEMYFLVEGKLYESERMGPVSEIPVASQVNNIAVVNASRNIYLEGYHGKRDWLAIITHPMVYSLFRDNDTFALFSPISTAVTTAECRITNGGFKSLDFQYKYPPSNPCFGAVEHVYFNRVGSDIRETILPDQDIYSGNVNCTYFEAPFNLTKDGNAGFDYWGADQGLFVKTSGGCGLDKVRQLIPNVKINDLEELNFFRDFFNDKIVLAAAEDGLYYSTRDLFPEGTTELDRIGFNKLRDLEFSVNSIAIEVSGLESERTFICQSAVWLATAKGIIKIPMNPASKSINKDVVGRQGPLVSVDAGLRAHYCVSNGENYTFTVNLPDNNAGNYTIRWLWHRQFYAQRAELPNTIDINPQTFNSGGEYGVRITSPCGESIDIGNFWLRDPDPVTVDFNYPDVVSMPEGCSFKFTAKPGNQYQWGKDGQILSGQTSNTFTATEPGTYQLFYYDECSNDYEPVAPVQLQERSVADPVITRSNNLSLCYGETVTLSVDDPGVNGVTYKWQRNGNPISDAVSRELEADLPGNYDVTLMLGECAIKRSATAVVVINEALKLATPPEVQICTIRAQRLKLTAPEGFAKYTWEGVEGINPVLEVTAPGQYTLDVEDASGCTASTTYIVVPYCAPPVPPNAFSPNGDGVNDLWTVAGLEDDPDAKIHVYNRFGVSVFDGSAKRPSWNGKLKGTDVPDGTYYYVVIKSSAKPVTGSLVLIR